MRSSMICIVVIVRLRNLSALSVATIMENLMRKIQKYCLLWSLPMILIMLIGFVVGYWALGVNVFDWGKSLWKQWLTAMIVLSPVGIGGGIFFLRNWKAYPCARVSFSQTEWKNLWWVSGFLILFFVPITLILSYAQYSSGRGLLLGAFRLIFSGLMMFSLFMTVLVFVSASIVVHCRDRQRHT